MNGRILKLISMKQGIMPLSGFIWLGTRSGPGSLGCSKKGMEGVFVVYFTTLSQNLLTATV
jgi:hypothetical protein